MIIRPACNEDITRITDIYNDAIRNSLAVWTEQTTSIEERAQWVADRQAADLPVLVADWNDTKVVGFASYGPFRPKEGYRHTAEHSVYVDPAYREKGIASALMKTLIEQANKDQLRVLIGGVESSNIASVKLHEKLGFFEAGTLRDVGTKFGKRLDLTLMQLCLEPHQEA